MKLVVAFSCENCGADGKISVKNKDDTFGKGDIVFCPLCSADIYDDTEDEDE